MRRGRRQRGGERGAALILMMLILVLGVTAVLVRELTARSREGTRAVATARVLAEAKEALLGYATTFDATNPAQYGFLPCPDTDTAGGFAEGEAHATCGPRYRNALGRLPWRTLGVEPARQSLGECLWYVVSGTWKAAGAAAPERLNPDSNGQLRVLAADGSTVVAGALPAERPVAVIIAPGAPVPGQLRTALGGGVEQCGGSYAAARYLDADAGSGISNATLSAAADAIDDVIAGGIGRDDFNDQLVYVTRAEIEARLMARADVQAALGALGDAVARCLADYGRRNAGGPGDRRLPWPADVDLAGYRADSAYDDTPIGILSGRVPDRVNDSAAATGNPLARVLGDCSSASVPEWTATRLALWRHWKDHFFYAVADSFRPDASPHSSCGTCLTVNGSGGHAAVVLFAATRLAALGQVRDEPPADADTRGVIAQYLEGRNAANHPNSGGDGDYQSATASATFNDALWCIAPDLTVSPC